MSTARDTEIFEKNRIAGEKWLARFGSRASKITGDVLDGVEVKDPLTVPVFVTQVGLVHVELRTLLLDKNWRNGVYASKRNQAKVLDDTFMVYPIYEFLQKANDSSVA
ncbi:MAG: hypothetical protein CBC65_001615 [Rhodothermaceae bacterium TMED105]|jgi:hypothetical protein|nr:MAG: hypothetical protein CBC65_001615 [Rhodothermaceae bacterium TMED105]